MMKRLCFALFAIISIFLTACATTGPKYSEMDLVHTRISPGKARLYFLRESRMLFSARSAPIKTNGEEIGEIGNGGFFIVDLMPGTHRISTKTWDAGRFSIEIEIQADKVYYIEVLPRKEFFSGGLPFAVLCPVCLLIGAQLAENYGMFALVPIDEKAAAQKLQNLRYSK